MRRLTITPHAWPIRGQFVISRGAVTEVQVLTVVIEDGDHRGWAECRPYGRYGETVETVAAEIEALRPAVEGGLTRAALQERLHAGSARNALDCALWDLEAKQKDTPVWQLAGLAAPRPMVTAYTLSIDAPDAMGRAAEAAAARPLLKIKLGGDGLDLDRVAAVRAHAPQARLIIDANEAWTFDQCRAWFPDMARLGVALIEQPMAADADAALRGLDHPVPLCADESCHTANDVARFVGLYEYVNIKLDKTGGLTEALRLKQAAQAAGLGVMVGCMLAGSLAMAPAMLLGADAEYIDLDGPLLLAQDREPGLVFQGSVMQPCPRALWG